MNPFTKQERKRLQELGKKGEKVCTNLYAEVLDIFVYIATNYFFTYFSLNL